MITVSSLGFLGCFQNQIISVFQFQLRMSTFYNQADINGTTLIVCDSNASLDEVAFIPDLLLELSLLLICAMAVHVLT